MFGFVKPEQGTLLVKEYAFYKATYCGICRQMKAHTGLLSPIFLTYDSVFLALVRMVFEDKKSSGAKKGRCLAHPLKSRPMLLVIVSLSLVFLYDIVALYLGDFLEYIFPFLEFFR